MEEKLGNNKYITGNSSYWKNQRSKIQNKLNTHTLVHTHTPVQHISTHNSTQGTKNEWVDGWWCAGRWFWWQETEISEWEEQKQKLPYAVAKMTNN